MGRNTLWFCTVDYVDTLLIRNQEAIRQCDRDIQADPARSQLIGEWRAAYEVLEDELRAMRERMVHRITTGHPATTGG